MSPLQFAAPGKVVLLGEYAVLDGSPALVAAVPSGVSVSVTWDDQPMQIATPHGDDRFVRAALEHSGITRGTWTFADHLPPDTRTKPGLGGSAAATVVAVWAAHTLLNPRASRHEVFEAARTVHHQVQGSGSGIDVAASVWGGALRYAMHHAPVPIPPFPVTVVWSGASAKTGPRVDQYRAWSPREEFVSASQHAVLLAASDPVAAFQLNYDALCTMAAAAGIAYQTPELDAIVQIARTHGGAAKPSGAGGGDCAVATFRDAESHLAFCREVAHEGFSLIANTMAAGVGAL